MLKHTPAAYAERSALRVNPAKTCQPIGAMYAALGIHGCLPHSHGSQGCCSYHRSHLTRHFREPVMASTSSFTEGASVFGGGPNLRQALKTIFQVYDPDMVAVHTTCLSETIGDDIPTITKVAMEDGTVPQGKKVIHCNTPSYVGSHVTGFSNMVEGMVNYLAADTGKQAAGQVNVIPGFVEPSDMRKIKGMLAQMGVDGVVFPDTSDVLDTPQTGEYRMYPAGGTTQADFARSGDSMATLALGAWASEAGAKALEKKCGVPYRLLDTPIGVLATDRFLTALQETTGMTVPRSLKDERGKLVDMMTDYQSLLFGKRVAAWGDPDIVIPLVEFLVSAGMRPTVVVTGTPGKAFERRIAEVMEKAGATWDYEVRAANDLFHLHQRVKAAPVDLLVGNSYGKYIAQAEDTPLVRFGFPILDRVGHSHFPKVGYMGGMHLLSQVINTLLERKDRDTAPEDTLELVM
jgi:nitrogenase molybdenum-iron protein beta chain